LSLYQRKDGVGYWCKKVRGRRIYFEATKNDPDGEISLKQWLRTKDALLAGEDPERVEKANSGLMLGDLCEFWMEHQEAKLNAGDIGKRTFDELHAIGKFLLKHIRKEREVSSIVPQDFAKVRSALAANYGPNGLNKRITQIRSLFRFAYLEGHIDREIRYGKSFEKPSAKTMRKLRSDQGRMDFTREEILAMLEKATVSQKAMVLLGINGALGNSDVADLPKKALDLKHGWLDYPREKTAVERRIPLWKETVEAIQAAMKKRPSDGDFVFVSARGQDYRDESRTGWRVTGEFRQVLAKAKIPSRKRGFYSLRRTFQTQAEKCYDLVAVKAIMGHAFSEQDMSARYRQTVDDERLLRATNVVRTWLFGDAS
jgi:integrase